MQNGFVCTAIPGPAVSVGERRGKGVNAGIRIVDDSRARLSPDRIPLDRVRELLALSSAKLLEMVRIQGDKLPLVELWFIHDLALGRLSKHDELTADDAVELSRATMRLAILKVA